MVSLRSIAKSMTLFAILTGMIAGVSKLEAKGFTLPGQNPEVSLEKFFKKRVPFGPAAKSQKFSFDGKYAAYLYRPYGERRHGSDLFLYEGHKGQSVRVTSAAVMYEFQKSARVVADSRDKKAPRAVKNKTKRQNYISKTDAVGRGPSYRGIQSYVWSPVENKMIFVSGGDLYLLDADTKKIERLTNTRESERSVQFLPKGDGYTYLRESSLMCVKFGSHLIEQLDPRLEFGEKMSEYSISPNGKRLVFLSYRSRERSNRKVDLISYRDRFTKAYSVNRHVPGDAYPDAYWGVYLYELADSFAEKTQLKKVYSHKSSGPRDSFPVPAWAPDSSKVAFAVFEQKSDQIKILEAGFDDKEVLEKLVTKEVADDETSDDENETVDAKKDKEAESEDEDEDEVSLAKIVPAEVIYRFLHNGGPNTPKMVRPQYLADSNRVVFLAEISGFRHLHVLDPTYEQLTQVTRGRREVYPINMSKDRSQMFVTATLENDPSQVHVYSVDLNKATMRQMSGTQGVYSDVTVCPNGICFLANHSDFGVLRELVAVESREAKTVLLTDSHPKKAAELTTAIPEYFNYKNRHGHTIYGHMFKPDDMKPGEKRPLLIYVYGGPLGTRNMIKRGSFSGSSYFFAQYMAKKHGYITCTIDPRGASGLGGVFEKSNFENVGKPQTEDLVDGVKYFIKNHGVDEKRVAIHGWSFGGFQTQMCLYTQPDVFAVGIAGAGPTEWENYNSWYSTGTVGKNKEGETKLKKFSLLPLAKNLKGKLMLAHGMEDSNVLFQDTVKVYRELLKAGKETNVELFLDPTGGHGMGGDVKSIGRYRKYEDFLLRTIGEGKEGLATPSPDKD